MRKFVQSLPHPIANTLFFARRFREIFYEDGLATVMNADFRKAPAFKRTYSAAKATGSFGNWNVRWRVHHLTWFAELASRVEGDFVECGTDHGGTAMAVMEHLDFGKLGKKFWLLDTFAGLPQGDDYLDYADCYEQVRKNFAGRDYVRIVRGAIPATLPEVTAEKIAFLHLDMNATVPEIAALEYFWPKLSSGAVVVMDDYGWPRHKDQKAGFDRFAQGQGVNILQLPTGQGVTVKPL